MNSKLSLSFTDYFNKSCDRSNRSTGTFVNRIICTNYYIVLTERREVLSIKALRYGTPLHKHFKNFSPPLISNSNPPKKFGCYRICCF